MESGLKYTYLRTKLAVLLFVCAYVRSEQDERTVRMGLCLHARPPCCIIYGIFRKLDTLGHDMVVEFCNVNGRKNECVVLSLRGK